MKFDPSILLPGDVLLYRPTGFFGWLISVKTWSDVSHVEVYIGDNSALASRDGVGVARYMLRTSEVGYVMRPKRGLNLNTGLDWFYTKANGQKYDWKGILVFSHAVKQGNPNKMFCSEFVCRLFRDGFLLPLFNSEWDSDRTPPAMLLSSLSLELVWSDGKKL